MVKCNMRLYDCELADLIAFGKAYALIGDSVAEQVNELLDKGEDAEVSLFAIGVIEDRLLGYCRELDDAYKAWMKNQAKLSVG